MSSIPRAMQCAILSALIVAGAVPLAAQRTAPHGTLVYAVGREPAMPIPPFTQNQVANEDVADQLFLHLATFKPGAAVSGDNALAPSLAKAWHRVDPLTLVFDLDRRARWHDGTPVTAHDVVFSWQLASNPKIASDASRLDPIASVEAIDQWTVRVRFKQAYAEQVYTFAFLLQPVPAHLLEHLAPEAIPGSDFARHPIGDGPFRFERRVPGASVELRADTSFFLGRPTLDRIVFRYVEDANTRLNLFLTGETDILDHIPGPMLEQARAHAESRLVEAPSSDLSYLLFNTRSPGDTTRAHPLFSDPRVREALALALDRAAIARLTFGSATPVPDAAQSMAWGWITGGIHGTPPNVARARALLAGAGWRDTDGDGVLDRNGVKLRFGMLYAASSATRNSIALQAQQMWRAIGAQAEIDKVEGGVMGARVASGQWDILVHAVGQDPTPSSLVQSWSCRAARQVTTTNFARWCDSTFDRLVLAATTARDQPAAWRAALDRMTAQHPAVFVAAPLNIVAVHRRYDNVIIWPSRTWLSLWQWRVRPEAALPRDR